MEQKEYPTVSICVTTYNRKELLKITINSILRQTYNNFEIILVDDASTDGTKEYIEKEILTLDSRIRYIRHQINRGLAAGRNTAIFNAKGKYFTFCDDDDIWHHDFLKSFINYTLLYNDNWSFCCGQINENSYNIIPDFELTFKDALRKGYTPPVASQFYLRKNLIEIEGYNENILSGVDHDLWIRFACNKKNFKIKGINKALVIRQRNQIHEKMTTNELKRIKKIQNSLLIWEKQIIDVFGQDFFSFFKKNYIYYENRKFFISKVKEKKFLNAYENFKKLDINFLILDVFLLKYILDLVIKKIFFKFGKKTIKLKNTFFQFNNTK